MSAKAEARSHEKIPIQEVDVAGRYAKNSDFITKAMVALAVKGRRQPYPVYLRGSMDVDQAMNPGVDLSAIQYRLNRARMPRDISGTKFVPPDLYAAPRDRGIRIQADNDEFIPQAVKMLTDSMHIPASESYPHNIQGIPSWKRSLAGFDVAWRRDRPKDELRLSHEKLKFAPYLPIFWYTWFGNVMTQVGESDYQVQTHRIKDMTATMEAIDGDLDRRHKDRCFTFDGLRTGVSLDPHIISRMELSTPKGIRLAFEALQKATLELRQPVRPKDSTLSENARRYYTEGIHRGNNEAVDSFVEVLTREYRKLAIWSAKFSPAILPTVRSFMDFVGPLWRSRSHDAALLEAYEGDIKVALEIDPIRTLWNLHHTRGYLTMHPDVQAVMSDPKAVREAETRIRTGMNIHGFEHNANIFPLRSRLVNQAIGSLIWPNQSDTNRIFRPVDKGVLFDPWEQ